MEIDIETPQFNIETSSNTTTFDVTIVPGAAATVNVGTTSTGAPGSAAAVVNSGTPNAAVLDFTIPQGPTGPAATVAVGTVTTGTAGSQAAVSNSGSSGAAVLNFTIPRGQDGEVTLNTAQTLTNKTLTEPKIEVIKDLAGNPSIVQMYSRVYLSPLGRSAFQVNADASSVNFVGITGKATSGTPEIYAAGNDTNVSLNLTSKGTGTVKVNGIDVVSTSGAQTLTNKTISGASNTLSAIPQSAVTNLVDNYTTFKESLCAGSNLLPNGSFEQTTLYLGGTNCTYSNEQAKSGSYSLKITGDGSIQYPTLMSDVSGPMRLWSKPGKVYYAEVWFRGHASNTLVSDSEILSMGLWCYDSASAYCGSPRILATANQIGVGSWVKVSGFITIPANTVTIAPLIVATSNITAGNIYYVDDAVLYEANFPVSQLLDANNNVALSLSGVSSAVNYLQVNNAASAGGVVVQTAGADTNVALKLQAKGTSPIVLAAGNTNNMLTIYPPAGAVNNYFNLTAATAGGTPEIAAIGSDTNINLNLKGQGTGTVQANGNPVVTTVSVPATATSTGKPGQIAYDSSYLYVCTATDTWRRAALTSW